MLRGGQLEVSFEQDHLRLVRYPFLGRNRGRRLAASELAEVLIEGWAPPCVRTGDDELLFVPATEKEELTAFAERHRVPLVERVDVWSLILEPFLDTEHSAEYLRACDERLAEHGITGDEVRLMRGLVRRRMLALTLLTWEWCHYGLFDVLDAMLPCTWTTGWSFERFYGAAMSLALRR